MNESRVAIVGHRSWISKALATELSRTHHVQPIDKAYVGSVDFTGFACVYLVLGRARPSPEEEVAEREQLEQFLNNPAQPHQAVYLSSQRVTESKRQCEAQICESKRRVTAIRPGAIFGPGQSLSSEMLVPSLAREGEALVLNRPDWPTRFIYIDDLVAFLVNFSNPDWWNSNGAGEPFSIFDVPGTFSLLPNQVRSLFRTWAHYYFSEA